MVLTLREMFEKEIENGLNRYGIYIDKTWKDGRFLKHMKSEELDNKKRIEAFIKRQESTGLSQSQATKEFIKEASYTWINRLIGLKCMETRGLIDEEVITIRDKFGGSSERHRNFIKLGHPELAHTTDAGLTACFMDAFREVTEEIKILFDPDNEYSLIVPRYRCLKDAIDLINNSVNYGVYKEDEFLGWVYQYFQIKEKDRIFDEVYKKKKKISGSDIIPVTSLYTEKYMVRFLVENSLGAIWMEMYPESTLYTNWEYFVKDPNNTTREPKQIKEIKFLDPACGSGHFLLYAFDIFYQMYKEEGVVPEKDIPNYILKYNLHGIDIDLRSVQLSALGLWMKSKRKNPNIKIEQMNLVAANAIMLDGDILDEFLEEFGSDILAKELVKTIWRGLLNVRELGSLLKVEEQIDEVIERVKSQTRIGEEWEKEQFSWERWKQRVMGKLRKYYEKAAQTFDISRQMFASETIKGLSFIDLISQKYDVVATNPPYMHNRNMGSKLRKNLKVFYPDVYFDLYVAFINRCSELSNKGFYVAMITQQSFMFISTLEKIRSNILDHCTIRSMVQLGPHGFEDIGGEKVNTVLFVISKKATHNYLSTFFRLSESYDKRASILSCCNNDSPHLIYKLDQHNFKTIEKNPFIYWVSGRIFKIFKAYKKVRDFADPKFGINTGNNDLFVRYWWEINQEDICIDKKWTNYMKGGEFNKYYGNQDYVVNFDENAMSRFSGSAIRNREYFYREGITYSGLGSKGISMRYLPEGFIFNGSGPCIFPKDALNIYLLGLLNSSYSNYICGCLNPTLSTQVGDIARIPYKEPDTNTEFLVNLCTQNCVSIKQSLLQFVINDREFKQPAILWGKRCYKEVNYHD